MALPVQLFHTCLVNEIDPDVGLAAVRVLERGGSVVEVPPDQTCCGQPAFNAGFQADARLIARHTLRVLDRTTGAIVIPSGSCADMIVHQYPRLFEGDERLHAQATRVAARCCEFSQFVAAQAGRPRRGALETTVAYHPSCHLLRGLGVRTEPLQLIGAVPGAAQAPVAEQEECCGFGGLFAIKNAEISSAMLDRKVSAIEGSGADRLVCCDLGCLLHLGGGLHRRGSKIRVQHLAQFLDEADSA